METIHLFIIIGVVLNAIYWFIKWKQSYWLRHGILYMPPKPLFGFIEFPKTTSNLALRLADVYKEYKNRGQMIGLYFFLKPVLIPLDSELRRNILIKDFRHFQNRSTFYNEKVDPLSAHLFNVKFDKWRPLRSKLTPTFTSGKMKFMFPTVVSVANEFVNRLSDMIKIDNEVEINDLLGRFTTDIIGTCAFGIECNSMKDPNAMFRKMGKKVFDQPKLGVFRRSLVLLNPELAKKLGVKSHHEDVTTFFLNIVKETVAYREQNKIQRNDFMDLLIKLKNDPNGELGGLTINEIAAQAFVFFLAGFETSSTTLTYCLYELALEKNKHIQDKARHEIQTILKKYNGELTYEALNEMTYVDQIVNETLRMHSPAGTIHRMCSESYKIPGTDYTIPKGMMILIPIYGIHHDPEIYEKPDEFIPERFSPDAVNQRPSCTFLPFGDGPRNCIGLRFGMIQARIGLVKLLQNFEFSKCDRTINPLVYHPDKIVISPVNGVWLKITNC